MAGVSPAKTISKTITSTHQCENFPKGTAFSDELENTTLHLNTGLLVCKEI